QDAAGIYFDGFPPSGQGGAPAAQGGAPGTGAGGADAQSESAPSDASPPDAGEPPDASAPEAPAHDAASPDQATGPDGHPAATTLTLTLGTPLFISSYGLFAWPFDPAMATRTLGAVSPSTIVKFPTTGMLTCFASEAQVVGVLSTMPVTSLGAATVFEFRAE